jgi:hypothetical protein
MLARFAPKRFLYCGVVAASVIAAACGSSTSTALAIGDPCLVGRWDLTSSSGTATSNGVTINFSGEEGVVMTLTAAGAETDDYSNASPTISRSSDGHTESSTLRGTMQYGFHGAAGKWVQSGGSGQITETNHLVDGVKQPDSNASAPAGSGTYSCSSSALTVLVGGNWTVNFTKTG